MSHDDYLLLLSRGTVVVAGKAYHLRAKEMRLPQEDPSAEFRSEETTVWSFPNRGSWATHVGDFRGNWSPYLPRNIILRYSNPGETVLDPMCGAGTSLIECKLLHRRGIGVDINPDAVLLTRDRLWFDMKEKAVPIRTFIGDARHLMDASHSHIANDTVDLALLHPPYFNAIKYSSHDHDLSRYTDLSCFLDSIRIVANEIKRVLKPGRFCAVLIGDTRRQKRVVPVAFEVLQSFRSAGLFLQESAVKLQWNPSTTMGQWKSCKRDFLLIMHEHLFIFQKPCSPTFPDRKL